jgi:hypothetical protein
MNGVRTHNFSGDTALIAQIVVNPIAMRLRPPRPPYVQIDIHVLTKTIRTSTIKLQPLEGCLMLLVELSL